MAEATSRTPPRPNENRSQLLELMDVVTNYVLRQRGVYPDLVFRQKLAYGQIPVYQIVDEPVKSYIEAGLASLGDLIDSKEDAVTFLIVLIDGHEEALESYRITLHGLNLFCQEQALVSGEAWEKFYLDCRNVLLSLGTRISDMAIAPVSLSDPEASFVFELATASDIDDLNWFRATEKALAGRDHSTQDSSTVIPVYSFQTPFSLRLDIDIHSPKHELSAANSCAHNN